MTVDFHAHILPKCDHGSDSIEVSLRQLELAKASGVDVICATSHFYPDKENVEEFLERRERCYAELMKAREGINDAPKILRGAEILACVGLDRHPRLADLCLEGTDLLLVEMPFSRWHSGLFEMMEGLSEKKEFTTVMAHADRYEPEDVERIIEMGIPLQLNVSSLATPFVKKHLKDWLDRELVVAFGSDIHGTDKGYRNWDKTCRRLKGQWHEVIERTADLIKG